MNRIARLVREVWRLRGPLDQARSGLVAEVATALDTAIEGSLATRAALAAYRVAMKVLIACAVVVALAGVVMGLVFRDSTLGLVGAAILVLSAVVMGWNWWVWSTALRFLKENVDPTRRVPLNELPARLRQLAAEAAPSSKSLADGLRGFARAAPGPPRE